MGFVAATVSYWSARSGRGLAILWAGAFPPGWISRPLATCCAACP
jgi:hypothetical protein